MSFKDLVLEGSKGGGGSFRNRPDNLRSTDTFELLVGLGTGRIKLAPGGLQNLFIDDVAVEDAQRKSNFKDLTASLFDGDPTVLQPVKLQLGASSGMTPVGLTLTNTVGNGTPGAWVTAAVTQPNCDFIDVRFLVQALYKQDKNGIGNATATIDIEMRPSGAANWISIFGSATPSSPYNPNGVPYTGGGSQPGKLQIFSLRSIFDNLGTNYSAPVSGGFSITGKTTSPFVQEVRIAVPNTGAYANKTWEVRCRLREIDYSVSGSDGQNESRRTVSLDSLAGAIMEPLGGIEDWRGLSYLQLFGKASDQINGIPEVTGIYDLDLYQVPPNSVWNPTTQQYTGAAWDGVTTQLAWTPCPAFQLKKVIEDGLSGISALAPGSTLNKWDALDASKWFSQLVPDGRGGMHPRYQMHWFLEQGLQAHELVNYLAGAVGSYSWDEGDGRWRLKVEKPETPAMIVTKETINGEFVYSHTDIDTRFNDITAVFRNKDNRYAEDRVRVFDQASIDATGRRHTTIALVGCDNRQEAIRRAYIRLLTGLNETRMVTFSTNRMGGMLEPFSVVGVADGDLNTDTAIRSTGRVVSMNVARTEIDVRDTLRLEVGVAYKIKLTVPNPNYNPDATSQPTNTDWRKPTIAIERTVMNTAGQRGDVTKLYLDQALPANTPEFAAIALEAVGLPALPKQYRVLGVIPADDGETVAVSAVEIFTSKWTLSDNITEEALNAQVSNREVPPPIAPTGGVWKLKTFNSDLAQLPVLTASWQRPGAPFFDYYKLEYRHNFGPWQDLGQTRETFYEMQAPQHGVHDIRIYAVNRRGTKSVPLEAEILLEEYSAFPPSAYLTNETHTVAASATGTGYSLSAAGGDFVVSYIKGELTEGVTYGVLAADGTTVSSNRTIAGLTMSIDAATGIYSLSGGTWTTDQVSFTLRAVWKNFAIDKIYTITKSRAGANGSGTQGVSSANVFLYQRKATQPLRPSGSSTYTFSTGVLSAVDNGWTQAIPANNGQPLWVTAAVASAAAATDAIAAAEWASPVILAQDGAEGSSGANAAVVYIYQRKATAPSAPTANVTYNFSSGALTGLTNGWSQSVPTANGLPLWVSNASALSTTDTDTIPPTEWNAATVMAQDGSQGPGGPVIAIAADKQGFTYLDNVATPASQTITLSAIRQNTTETVVWTVSPAVTLGGSGLTRTIDLADFGTNRQVTITATGQTSGVVDKITIVRLDLSTAEQLPIGDTNRVRFSQFESGTMGWWTRLNTGNTITSYLAEDATNGIKRIRINGTFTASGQLAGIVNDYQQAGYRIPVTPGERIYAGVTLWAAAMPAGSTWRTFIRYFDVAGAAVPGEDVTIGTGTSTSTITVGTFAVVPAGAVHVMLDTYIQAGAAGTYSLRMYRPIITSAGVLQTVPPSWTPGPSSESGADVTLYIDGSTEYTFKYSSTGQAESGEFTRPLPFTLRNANGVVSSDVTWKWVIAEGTVNATDASATEYAMTSSGAGAYASVDSLGADTNTVVIRAYYGGRVYSKTISLKKTYLAPPSSGGSAGGGGTAGSSQTSGFTSITNTTPVDVSQKLAVPITGSSLTVDVNLTVRPDTPSVGSWTVNLVVWRETTPGSNSWVQIGAVASDTTSVVSIDLDGTASNKSRPKTLTFSRQATSLGSGTHNIKVTGYLSSGARLHTISGTVSTKTP